MSIRNIKYLFAALSILLLAGMVLGSRKSGINCDEVLHYNHSLAVLNFYSSGGKDTSALNTPVTHLKYYGQSYDNLTTLLIRTFNIDDIYGFRHLMSTIAGWLTALVAALFAIWLSGYEAGIFVLLLFSISPTFLGHAQNNLKDIPFAFAYISGIYLIARFLHSDWKNSFKIVLLLILAIGFCISIRPGGLILICFLLLFLAAWYSVKYLSEGFNFRNELLRKIVIALLASSSACLLATLFWPYALQDPLRNPINSYRVMVHFPDTFRQIFEGRNEWSDYMPWYYLPKSMAITIPLTISAGFIISFFLARFGVQPGKRIFVYFLFAAVLLPVVFVMIAGSSLYSGWRHFLFVYPAILILASLAFTEILKNLSGFVKKSGFWLALLLASLHPAFFIVSNPQYSYLYYNQMVGGIKGAYGNYETDYYFISQREASVWLLKYFDENEINEPVIVGSNFSAEWFFRHRPEIRNVYFRNEERSMHDWDYLITTNRYFTPWQLKNGAWPPDDALKVIHVDGVPVSSITKRKTKDDLHGYKALSDGRNAEAVKYLSEASAIIEDDEMIFYNFAVALNRTGNSGKADSALMESLSLNPDFEPALMYLGNIALKNGSREKAGEYYRKLISVNRKYYEAYEALRKLN